MNSRKKILDAVAINKPSILPMPELIPERERNINFLEEEFEKMVNYIGGKLLKIPDLEWIQRDLESSEKAGEIIINGISEIGRINTKVNESTNAVFLETVYKVYLEARLGVAENGAVWLTENDMQNRLLPFICQHLVILLKRENLVSDMHAAYRRIKMDEFGFGLFLAGPSKTADIEQSLVIGAHGARSLLIYLLH